MTEKINCSICNSKNTFLLVADLRMCKECSHVFKNVDIDKKAYKGYVSSAHVRKTQKHIDDCNNAVNSRFNTFKIFAKKGKTLEIGSGHKYFLDKLKKEGYEPEGTELSKVMAEEIPHKMRIGNPSDLKDLPIYSNICAFHVIEHLNDPVKEIKYLMKHMKDDGVFVFEIPTMMFYGKMLNFNEAYESVHTQYFTQKSLMEMLIVCDLVPILQTTAWQGNGCVTTVCAVKNNKYLDKAKEKEIKYQYPTIK